MVVLGDAAPGKWSSTYLRWAIAAGVPVAWYLLSRRRHADEERTDFDGFLKVVEPVGSTGAERVKGKTSGPIDDFFKDADEQVDTRNPLDFDSFLRSSGGPAGKGAKTASAAKKQPTAAKEIPLPSMKPVTVMYGTEYGFSREIAEKLCTMLKASGTIWPNLENMADHPEGYDFSKVQVALVACSTQGDGVPPTEARGFCERLFAGKTGSLAHLKFAVCALGDKSYTHFCRCGKQLDAALEASAAQRLIDRVDVNKEDWPVVDGWISAVVAAVTGLALKSFSDLGLATSDASGADKGATTKKLGKSRPYYATVLALEGLCNLSSADDKNTIRMELDLDDSGLGYQPGDALGMYPTNDSKAVDNLIRVMGASPSDTVPVPSWHYDESASGTGHDGGMPLEQALTKCYDIRSPKAELLKLLVAELDAAHATANGDAMNGHGPSPKQQLREALSDAAAAEKYLAPRHVVDVLQDASSARLSIAQVLSCLRQLQPRLYSISSSPLENPGRVQVTVAEVKYLSLGKERIGVCSTMLSERLQVGALVPVYVHKNPDFRLPPSSSTPLIMVGPGTGLAPFRSFIMQRLLEQEQAGTDGAAAPGQMVLYFGCRRRDQDYLYGKLLEGWSSESKITLLTAFSREQNQKVYVQNRLAESADLVWKLLQEGGHFYVCGDAGSMAGAVEQALLKLVEDRQDGGRQGAEAYLKALSDSGRYQRDVWY